MPPRPSIAGAASLAAAPSAATLVHLADAADAAPDDGLFASIQAFQDSHAFLISIVLAIITRLIILEARNRIEKPVMDELGNRVSKEITPDTESIGTGAWAKLAACVALDLAGDASELVPVLGEFTDLAYAPVEAALLKAFFQSNAIAGFGFLEELLPFTDVVPTFTLSWCLSTLWPTTPLAQRLLPKPEK